MLKPNDRILFTQICSTVAGGHDNAENNTVEAVTTTSQGRLTLSPFLLIMKHNRVRGLLSRDAQWLVSVLVTTPGEKYNGDVDEAESLKWSAILK